MKRGMTYGDRSRFVVLVSVGALLSSAGLLACGASQDVPEGGDDAGESVGGTGMNTGGGSGSGGGGTATGGNAAGTGGGNSSSGGSSGELSTGDVVVHATFADQAPGTYSQGMVAADFGAAPAWNDGLDEGRATIVLEGANKFLRVTYPAGQYGPGAGGVQFQVPLGGTYQELYLAYRVRFGAAFEWVKGGKLPGLVGGTSPTGCLPKTDPESLTGFSARMMWRPAGLPVQYLYFPERASECGDDFKYQVGGVDEAFVAGTWHTVQHRIVMNTPPAADGIMQAWFDGVLVVDVADFVWRLEGHEYGVDALYFSTFFGGGDETWAPSVDQTIDYDDFVIATGPIHL